MPGNAAGIALPQHEAALEEVPARKEAPVRGFNQASRPVNLLKRRE
jgi:hypothetical protein